MKYTTKQLIERLDTEIEMVCCDSARADWQTLKNRVLTPQADNAASAPCEQCKWYDTEVGKKVVCENCARTHNDLFTQRT